MTIEKKPFKTITMHDVSVVMDKEYKAVVIKEQTEEGHAYEVKSDLENDEKRIVHGHILNYVTINGI
jgi:hypothetical protein